MVLRMQFACIVAAWKRKTTREMVFRMQFACIVAAWKRKDYTRNVVQDAIRVYCGCLGKKGLHAECCSGCNSRVLQLPGKVNTTREMIFRM